MYLAASREWIKLVNFYKFIQGSCRTIATDFIEVELMEYCTSEVDRISVL